MLKVLVVNPVGTDRWDESDKRLFTSYASPETVVDVVSLDAGPESVESRRAYVEVLPLIVKKTLKLYKEYDGVIINCFLDPAVDALNSLLNVPVVGPCAASLALASILNWKIGIVTVGDANDMIEERIRMLGYENRAKSIRSIGIHVVDLDRDVEKTKMALVKECRKALDDGAKIIVLGCTGLAGLNEFVQNQLNVTVIDPAAAALKVLEAMIKLKVKQSDSIS
jgi:allantoin racemase